MKLTYRGSVFAFFGAFCLVNMVIFGWLYFRLSATGAPIPAWLAILIPALLISAGVFSANRLAHLAVRGGGKIGAQAFVAQEEECRRFVYVGTDSFREGRICGEMMAQALSGHGRVAMVREEHGNSLLIRESGFASILAEKYPGIEIVAQIGERDTVVGRFGQRLDELMRNFPGLDGIYVSDGNTPGQVIAALKKMGRAGRIKVVCHDTNTETMQGVMEGVVTGTLSQDPYAQGFNPVIYLYNYLVAGQKPPRVKMTTEMVRITPQNYSHYWDPQRGLIETEASQAFRVKPVNQLPNRKLRIIVLGVDPSGSTFFAPIHAGVMAAAGLLKNRNVTVEYLDPTRAKDSPFYDPYVFTKAVDGYRGLGYDGISLPIYDKAVVAAANRAVRAGMAVAVYNSEPESLNSLMASLVSQSHDLLDITVSLAQSAVHSTERAAAINNAIAEMKRALTIESESALIAIESTRQIASAIQGVDQGAQEQFSAAGSASEATRDISTAVEGTRQASLANQRTSIQAAQTAQEGAATIQQTLQQIESISGAINSSAEQIHALSKLSRQIDSIVATVTDLAEQTNMLALNANIEAARAGANGRGFAVVATEIRGLAEMSKTSTKEISALVRAVQKNSAEMVKTVDEATLQARTGTQLAKQAGDALHTLLEATESMRTQSEQVVSANATVVDSLDRLAEANQRVSAVIVQNASSVRQVTDNIQQTVERVNHMTGISKENVSTIEGIHDLSDEVADQAAQLKGSIAALVQMAEELQGAVVAMKLNQGS